MRNKNIGMLLTFILLTFFVLGMHYALAKEGSDDDEYDDKFASTQSIAISPTSVAISEKPASTSGSSGNSGSGRSVTPGGGGGSYPEHKCGNNICEDGEAGYCLCPPEAVGCMAPCYVGTCPKDCEKSLPSDVSIRIPSAFSLVNGQTAKATNYQDMRIKLTGIFTNPECKTGPCPMSDFQEYVKVEISIPGGCGPNADPECLGPPSYFKEFTIREGEIVEVEGSKLTLRQVDKDKADFYIEFLTKQQPVCGNNICEDGEANDCPPCGSESCTTRVCRVGTCPKDCESKEVIYAKVPSTFSLSVGQKANVESFYEMKLVQVSTTEKNYCCGRFDENTGTRSYFWSKDKYCGYEGMSCAGSCPSVVDQRYCNPKKACTAEAKICPDGTGVGRVPPNCEFAPCPGEAIQVTADTATQTTSKTITPVPSTVPTSQQFAVIEITTNYWTEEKMKNAKPMPIGVPASSTSSSSPVGIASSPTGISSNPPASFQQVTIFQGEGKEVSGTIISLVSINGNTATFKISFANEFGCDVELCKKYICCTGTTCPEGMPIQCGGCTKDICSATCGNGICEQGEDNYCPCSTMKTIGECKMPCTSGSCPQDCMGKQGTPVCRKIGTRQEGWYLKEKLIKSDKCTCTAVCKSTEKGQGYFSSCNNEFIQYAECFPSQTITVAVGVKKVEIKQDASAGVVVIKSEASAETKEKIVVEDKKLKVSTNEGAKEIILPEEAEQKAITSGLKQVSKIELKSENGKSYYEVQGSSTTYFLWFIPITTKSEIKVDAQTTEIIN